MLPDAQRWNHNVHYHRLILDAVPTDARRALDVGCGEGILSRRLRERTPEVTAIDIDPASLALARRQDAGADIAYVLADFLTWECEPASFDVVVSVAALHHMDARAALQRMRQLLRPGGVLAIVGLARRRYPADLPRDAAAAVVSRAFRCTRQELQFGETYVNRENFEAMQRFHAGWRKRGVGGATASTGCTSSSRPTWRTSSATEGHAQGMPRPRLTTTVDADLLRRASRALGSE